MQSNGLYKIKEIFGPTIEGEGSLAGTMVNFIRFSGCNMWDGRPETRAKSKCPYCDTDFFGGDKLTLDDITARLKALKSTSQWVTISGGEPTLQLDYRLVAHLHMLGYSISIETNGTKQIELPINHITCSPKVPREKMYLKKCDDLKLLYPHPNKQITPESFETFNAKTFFLQPVWDDNYKSNLQACLDYIYKKDGFWKLSIQTHKYIGVQ